MSLDVEERENHDWGWNRDFDKWRVPWWRKRPQLGWRGSQGVHKDIPTWPLEGSKRSTPSEREGKGVESFFFHPRTRLVQLGTSRPDLIDAGWAKFAGMFGEPHERVLEELKRNEKKPLHEDFSEKDWSSFRYIGVIDGAGMTIRFIEALLTNSVPVKHTSPFLEWYYDLVEPMRDYVNVSYSFSDLVEKLEWLNANPEEARRIAEQGTKRAAEFYKPERVLCDLARVLIGLAARLDFEVTVQPGMLAHPVGKW